MNDALNKCWNRFLVKQPKIRICAQDADPGEIPLHHPMLTSEGT